MLSHGGQLLIANFAPNHHDIGYMESCMDWWLKYRDEGQVLKLATGIHESHASKTFRDVPGNLVFLELTRGVGLR